MGGISIWQLLIVLGIVIVLFGTKKLRNVGSDLGGAIKGFKKAVSDEDKKPDADTLDDQRVISGEAQRTDSSTDNSKVNSTTTTPKT